MWVGSEVSARSPPCTLGCRVTTRCPRMAGIPVRSATSTTGTPASATTRAVPPEDTRCQPRSCRARATSTMPVLSYTESRAVRVMGQGWRADPPGDKWPALLGQAPDPPGTGDPPSPKSARPAPSGTVAARERATSHHRLHLDRRGPLPGDLVLPARDRGLHRGRRRRGRLPATSPWRPGSWPPSPTTWPSTNGWPTTWPNWGRWSPDPRPT